MVFEGEHQSVARFPELAARSVVVSSFGKTYHVTGWKVGYAAAPAALSAEFRKVHQFNVFTVNTPMQHGIAAFMADPSHHLELPAFYRAKRDRFRAGLEKTRLRALPCQGTYFPVRRLLGRQRQARGRLLPLADDRDRRRRDSPLRVLRRRVRAADRALLLRQEGRDAGARDRAPRRALGPPQGARRRRGGPPASAG
jgi:histidinol-phosphate/aromatic aminotransferase/cobyric acid decarboxylase-like protein